MNINDSLTMIGPIAPPQWGPAVRNRIMLDTLTGWGLNVIPLNTLRWREKRVGFLLDIVRAARRTRRVVISVSRNGRFVLIPLLALLVRLWNVRVAFIPAGGTFGPELKSMNVILKWAYVRWLRSFDRIYAQRSELADQLTSEGLGNVRILPNFKVAASVVSERHGGNVPALLFLSRIRPAKGIESLFEALDFLIRKKVPLTIDLFGIISPDYEDEFRRMLEERPYAAYKGVIDYAEVIPRISRYDLMVFPTVVTTEGFPGVLADAALAGLPVVASRVPSNLEIIEDGVNGVLAAPDDPQDLAAKIERVLSDPELRAMLAANNQRCGQAYDVNVVLRAFLNDLKALGW